jgi:hypothetical protein
MDVDVKNRVSMMFDSISPSKGMYYVGIYQYSSEESSKKDTLADLRQELSEKAENYSRVNLIAGSHENDTYIAGEGSNDKITWMKMSVEERERFFLFVTFSSKVRKAIVWIQGPSTLDLYPEHIEKGDFGHMKYVLSTLLTSNYFHTQFFKQEVVKVAVKVISSGFGIVFVKNLTNFNLCATIKMNKAKNIKLGIFPL